MTIENETETTPEANPRPWLLLLGIIVLLAMIGLGLIGYRILERLDAIETQVASLDTQAIEATEASELARSRSERAEQANWHRDLARRITAAEHGFSWS